MRAKELRGEKRLKALVSHPREPLSRDKLMNLARGREYSAMERLRTVRDEDVAQTPDGLDVARMRRVLFHHAAQAGDLYVRTDLPPAPHGGRGPGASALHPDRLGSGLRLRPGDSAGSRNSVPPDRSSPG